MILFVEHIKYYLCSSKILKIPKIVAEKIPRKGDANQELYHIIIIIQHARCIIFPTQLTVKSFDFFFINF